MAALVKPFRHPSELIARIRTRLRRTNADVSGLLTIGDLAIDVQAHQVTRGGKQIALTRLEFDLLVALAKEPGRVFTRDALLSEVWGYRHSTDTRLVNVHVQRLRSKMEHDAEHPRDRCHRSRSWIQSWSNGRFLIMNRIYLANP